MQDNKRTELNSFLKTLASTLDLTEGEREQAEKRYKYAAEWLEDGECDLAPYHPHIYPHGSFRLGTVVRPYGDQAEFDLDFVCSLQEEGADLSQVRLRELVGDRLKANGNWDGMVVPKTRCWRLDYAGEFHMDIMPAIPAATPTGEIIAITDRDYACWILSNPRGFAEWFDTQMVPIRRSIREGMMGKMAAEDLPDENKIKTPLQRAIQIMKRHRDIYFEHDSKDRPGSIILTTLAAKAYRQQADLLTALLEVAQGMPGEIEYNDQGFPIVTNPALHSENLAEKWREHPQRLVKFKGWLVALRADVENAVQSPSKTALEELLGEKFGPRVVKAVFEKQATQMRSMQSKGGVGVKYGSISVGAGASIPKNNYFGGARDQNAYL